MIMYVCSEVWNRFLEFESSVGDLASILKVEKRRAHVVGKVNVVLCQHFTICAKYLSGSESKCTISVIQAYYRLLCL